MACLEFFFPYLFNFSQFWRLPDFPLVSVFGLYLASPTALYMPLDKKISCPASSSQQKTRRYSADKSCTINNSCTEERNYQMKLKRHDAYIKIAADKKQAMLLQRRTKDLQQKKGKSVIHGTNERIESSCHPPSTKQTALTIREPPSTDTQESVCHEINTLSRSSNKGKQIFQPFCVFEKGSTSNTCKEQQNVTPELVTNRDLNSFLQEKKVTKAYNYIHKYGHKTKLIAAAVRNKQDVFNLLGVDYIITPLKALQSLKESVTLPDERYSFTTRLSPQSAAAFNFTQDKLCEAKRTDRGQSSCPSPWF